MASLEEIIFQSASEAFSELVLDGSGLASICLSTTTEFATVSMDVLTHDLLDKFAKPFEDDENFYRTEYGLVGDHPHKTEVLWNVNEWDPSITVFEQTDRHGSFWKVFENEFPESSQDFAKVINLFERVLERLDQNSVFDRFGDRSRFVIFLGIVGDPEMETANQLVDAALRLNADKIPETTLKNLKTYCLETFQ